MHTNEGLGRKGHAVRNVPERVHDGCHNFTGLQQLFPQIRNAECG